MLSKLDYVFFLFSTTFFVDGARIRTGAVHRDTGAEGGSKTRGRVGENATYNITFPSSATLVFPSVTEKGRLGNGVFGAVYSVEFECQELTSPGRLGTAAPNVISLAAKLQQPNPQYDESAASWRQSIVNEWEIQKRASEVTSLVPAVYFHHFKGNMNGAFIDYERGGSFTSYIRNLHMTGGPLINSAAGQELARGLLAQLIRGMKAIHARGIVHLDLKPDNIMINKRRCLEAKSWRKWLEYNCVVVIVDFGVSCITEDATHEQNVCVPLNQSCVPSSTVVCPGKIVTQPPLKGCAGHVAGTPAFMSLELLLAIVNGNARSITGVPELAQKADVWSIGIIHYWMLYSAYPYSGRTPSELLANVQRNLGNVADFFGKESHTLARRCMNPKNWRIDWDSEVETFCRLMLDDAPNRLLVHELASHPYLAKQQPSGKTIYDEAFGPEYNEWWSMPDDPSIPSAKLARHKAYVPPTCMKEMAKEAWTRRSEGFWRWTAESPWVPASVSDWAGVHENYGLNLTTVDDLLDCTLGR